MNSLSSIDTREKVYSIHHCQWLVKVPCFSWVSSTNKTDFHDKKYILCKVDSEHSYNVKQPPFWMPISNSLFCFSVAVVIAFFFCWAPFHSQRLMTLYVTLWTPELHKTQTTLFYISGMLHIDYCWLYLFTIYFCITFI